MVMSLWSCRRKLHRWNHSRDLIPACNSDPRHHSPGFSVESFINRTEMVISNNPVCRDREPVNETQTERWGGCRQACSSTPARTLQREAYPAHQPEDGPGVLEEGDRVEADAPGLGGAVRDRWLHPRGGLVLPDGRLKERWGGERCALRRRPPPASVWSHTASQPQFRPRTPAWITIQVTKGAFKERIIRKPIYGEDHVARFSYALKSYFSIFVQCFSRGQGDDFTNFLLFKKHSKSDLHLPHPILQKGFSIF